MGGASRVVAAALGLLLASGIGPRSQGACAEEIAVGSTRAVLAKNGVALREQPKGLSRIVRTLPHGTRVKVVENVSNYLKVTTEDAVVGWVKAADVVDPAMLTGLGPKGPVGSPEFSATEVSAAGGSRWGGTGKIEYRASDRSVEAYFGVVDHLEATQPTEVEIEDFLRSGHLGRPKETPVEVRRTKLRIVDPSGERVNPADDPVWSNIGIPAVSEADYISQMDKCLSPEQEYRLGRAVAANAISEHGLDADANRQALVRLIGACLVRLSDIVRTPLGGWHFAVLASKTRIGISGPGGFVLITRGALDLARDEEEIAGVIAHEIAHVNLKHGEYTIRRSEPWRATIEALKADSARKEKREGAAASDMARLLGRSAKKLVTTLQDRGYGTDLELAADRDATIILAEAGYRISGLAEYLEAAPGRIASWVAHPRSSERIDRLLPFILERLDPDRDLVGERAREARFRTELGPSRAVAPARHGNDTGP